MGLELHANEQNCSMFDIILMIDKITLDQPEYT